MPSDGDDVEADGDDVPTDGDVSCAPVAMSPQELYDALEDKDFLLINVHVPNEGEVPGTDAHITYLDPDAIAAYIGDDKSKKVVVYCLTNHMALIAAEDLMARGYCNISYLDGGMRGWVAASFDLAEEGSDGDMDGDADDDMDIADGDLELEGEGESEHEMDNTDGDCVEIESDGDLDPEPDGDTDGDTDGDIDPETDGDMDVEDEIELADVVDLDEMEIELEFEWEVEEESAPPVLTPLSPAELNQALLAKDFLLINVHIPYDGQVPQTDTHISYLDPNALVAYIGGNLDEKVVVYCKSNYMALISGNDLLDLGYRNILYLNGGMNVWTGAGYQLEYDSK